MKWMKVRTRLFFCLLDQYRVFHRDSTALIKPGSSSVLSLIWLTGSSLIVTGEPKGYGFIEFSEETACISAYQRANRALLGSKTILVDYERSRCMKGWVPRRLGGGLSGRKESGQLRFGGRDKPFKRPLNLYKSNDRNIPDIEFDQKYDDNWRKATHPNYAPSRSTQHLSNLERTSNKREQLGSPTNGPRNFSVRQDSHGRHTTGPVYYNRHHNSSRSSYQSSAGVTHRRSEVGAEEFRDRTTPSEQRRNSSSVDVRTRRRSPSPRRRFVDNDRRRKDDYGDGERQDSYDRTRREYRHSRNKR
ncbi:hypothetical protein BKA69DRAFT_1079004 [Paraphysoderma sedebokerense]|nr:hypothetical protein BKA69DRAFT_1079004 [Paraphysoderma sedebokerense]